MHTIQRIHETDEQGRVTDYTWIHVFTPYERKLLTSANAYSKATGHTMYASWIMTMLDEVTDMEYEGFTEDFAMEYVTARTQGVSSYLLNVHSADAVEVGA